MDGRDADICAGMTPIPSDSAALRRFLEAAT
jgi:hypothetical protein